MANNQATQKQENDKHQNTQGKSAKNEPIEKENGDKSLWRPTDNKTKDHSENPTGLAEDSPAANIKTDNPGRTPGKAEGEDFEE